MPSEEERRIATLEERVTLLRDMVRIFTVSVHTVHAKDDLSGGARMMLASMGRATLLVTEES